MTASFAVPPDAAAVPASRLLTRGEWWALLVLAATLPLIEAPKNLAWLAFVLLWIVNGLRTGQWGVAARGVTLVLGALFAVGVGSIAASPGPRLWGELGNLTVFLVLGGLLARTRMRHGQLVGLLAALVAATLVGVAYGFYMVNVGQRQWVELQSVGHVNHSALFGVGVALMLLGATCALWRALPSWQRGALIVLDLLFLAMIFDWESRGAVLAYLVGTVLIGGTWLRVHRYRLVPAAGVLALLAALVVWLNPVIVDKTVSNLAGATSSMRMAAIRTAVELWRQYPLTGAGAGNFKEASPARVQVWVEARGVPFVHGDYLFSNHAHSLYFNYLAERGLVGLAAVLAMLVWWAALLWRSRPTHQVAAADWLAWGMGMASFVLVFGGGLFNTTLHHEHGILAMLGLGALAGRWQGREAERA